MAYFTKAKFKIEGLMCQCPGHCGQHHRGLQGEGGGRGRGAQSPLPGQARPRAQHSLQAGVRGVVL